MKKPETREELKAQMAELAQQYDEILAAMGGLAAELASALDDVEPARLLEVARKQADREIAVQTHRAALESLERRFNLLAAQAAELDRKWAREQLAKRQPELDKRAAKIAETLAILEEQLREYHTTAEAIRDEVVLTPYVIFPYGFADIIAARRESCLKELGRG